MFTQHPAGCRNITDQQTERPVAKLTEERKAEIEARLAQNERPGAIAQALGVGRTTVWRVANEKAGRKSLETGDHPVAFRLSSKERAALDRAVKARSDMSRADYLREVLRVHLGFYEADDEAREVLSGLTAELRQVGGNLNQIAKDLSIGRRETGLAVLDDSRIAEVRRVERQVKALQLAVKTMLRRSQERSAQLAEALERRAANG